MANTISTNVPNIKPEIIEESKSGAADSPNNVKPDEHIAAAPDIGEKSTARHREGECIANIPDVKPDLLSEKEVASLASARPEIDEAMSEGGFFLSRWLRFGYVLVTVATVSLFGVFVFSQAISALSMASSLPEWQKWLLLTPLAACSLVLLFIIVILALSWFRLRRIRQIDMAALEELKTRADSRRDGIEHYQSARNYLEKYLADYPLTGRDSERLGKTGFSEEILDSLAKGRDYLKTRDIDSQTWLKDFYRVFQQPVDQIATARVNKWALRSAACVIASPLPLLDAILVLSISLKMIKELCVLYNVRTGGAASLLLFTRAIRNAFIAGVADEAGNAAGEVLGEEMTGMLGEGVLGTMGASAARVVIPKLGEGALNGLFMRRLGRATIRMLQPLAGK
jgi:Predicted membrane protein